MEINWAVRFKNKAFWLAFIPALLLTIQVCAAPFGYQWDFAILNQQLAAIVNAVFLLLALLGIVTDPTVDGISDSIRALNYAVPAFNATQVKKIMEEADEEDW